MILCTYPCIFAAGFLNVSELNVKRIFSSIWNPIYPKDSFIRFFFLFQKINKGFGGKKKGKILFSSHRQRRSKMEVESPLVDR